MRRIQPVKRDRRVTMRTIELKKPFGFCCDINYQDPETQYDMRNSPFESAFPDTKLDHSRPEVKFCVQDVTKVSAPAALRTAILRKDVEIKKAATYGKSKKGRGPLKWFLEEEIEAAQNLIAKEKEFEYKEKKKKITSKVKIRKRSRQKDKKHYTNLINLSNMEEVKSNDLEENKDDVTNN